MAGAEDEQVVQDLSTGGADEAFADRVRPRRSIGELQDFDTLGAEDLIEAGRELGVSIVEQVGGLDGAVLQHPGEVASLLDHPLPGGVGGDAREMDLAAMELDKEEDVKALEPDGLAG